MGLVPQHYEEFDSYKLIVIIPIGKECVNLADYKSPLYTDSSASTSEYETSSWLMSKRVLCYRNIIYMKRTNSLDMIKCNLNKRMI